MGFWLVYWPWPWLIQQFRVKAVRTSTVNILEIVTGEVIIAISITEEGVYKFSVCVFTFYLDQL